MSKMKAFLSAAILWMFLGASYLALPILVEENLFSLVQAFICGCAIYFASKTFYRWLRRREN